MWKPDCRGLRREWKVRERKLQLWTMLSGSFTGKGRFTRVRDGVKLEN